MNLMHSEHASRENKLGWSGLMQSTGESGFLIE